MKKLFKVRCPRCKSTLVDTKVCGSPRDCNICNGRKGACECEKCSHSWFPRKKKG